MPPAKFFEPHRDGAQVRPAFGGKGHQRRRIDSGRQKNADRDIRDEVMSCAVQKNVSETDRRARFALTQELLDRLERRLLPAARSLDTQPGSGLEAANSLINSRWFWYVPPDPIAEFADGIDLRGKRRRPPAVL